MKPQSFAYAAPQTLGQALALLAEHRADAAVLAGGQSLVPMMNLRLARPAVLVDINGIAELDTVTEQDGQLRIGATVRHHDLETGRAGGRLGAVLSGIAAEIGHLPIRVRGTMAGSLVHADPNAEWPVLVTALDGRVVLATAGGERVLAAEQFFDLPFAPAKEPDELLSEIRLPLLPPGAGVGFAEFTRAAGGFALAVVCAALGFAPDAPGTSRVAPAGGGSAPVVPAPVVPAPVAWARVAVGGVAGRPVRFGSLEQALVSAGPTGEPDPATFADAVAADLAGLDGEPPAPFLAAVVRGLCVDAVRQARLSAADGRPPGGGSEWS